jgi:ribonuclease BN (tRNA processing enzyme)
MKLTFAGVNNAFGPAGSWQTNALLTGPDGKSLLIDCGSDARHSLAELGVKLSDIDGVYVTHQHADHIGGLEWLAFCTFFHPSLSRPKLFCSAPLMRELWEHSLSGGLDSIEGKVMNLTDYFECRAVPPNEGFFWGGAKLIPVQTVHIMAGYKIVNSYGLLIDVPCPSRLSDSFRVFYTSDTQFCPNQISKFYAQADIIFQDCETAPYRSGVHAHYDDLVTLPPAIKAKMFLEHNQPNPQQDAKADGFAGFAQKGQVFELEP